jgi:hypothetical protein
MGHDATGKWQKTLKFRGFWVSLVFGEIPRWRAAPDEDENYEIVITL